MDLENKYVGITLIFVYPEGLFYEAVKRSYLIKPEGLNDIYKIAKNLGSNHEQVMKKEKCRYVGLYDIFSIYGKLTHGCILGHTTYWSYKSINKAIRLTKKDNKLGIFVQKFFTAEKCYIAKLIYFFESENNYKSNRTIIFSVLIKSLEKSQIIHNAKFLAQSPRFLQMLKKILLRFEDNMVDQLQFIGFADIQYVPDKVKKGNCFEVYFKNYKNLSSIRKLIPSMDKLKEKGIACLK